MGVVEGITLLVTALLSFVLVKSFIHFCIRHNLLAFPNSRSNHKDPTPVGGGVVILTIFFMGSIPVILRFTGDMKAPLILFMALALLCIISFKNDISPMSISSRLLTHVIAASLGACVVTSHGSIFAYTVHPDIEFGAIVFIIVGFMNIYNFMDGIDGMTGMETIFLCTSLGILFSLLQIQTNYTYISLLLASSTIGFLWYNWHSAAIFMGDAGSITIGYILSLLLLVLAAKGYWLQAFMLPMYYFMDAGLVLLIRIVKLQRFWEAHSEHFFQKAVRTGISHAEVVLKVAIFNIALFGIVLSTITQTPQKNLIALLIAIGLGMLTVCSLKIPMTFLNLTVKRSVRYKQ
ncbi:hypothetical protein EDM53_03220 [Rickettsiales endosymbiont of Peranema trichophorum]|uniref:hypothetical protein n=1 Tax=Rickettsiales endosymbiont of Peranema trichophorum TaxID=2486577 RepID=UPI001022D85A|nr:hypothetical protein [Rickettsiales endosymbiont of Peranema trichophorum]RZI47226.1 hypothetical protein EDM53_03220 [Rickettsiales endosymbiont of Peranema trichophorum]